MSRRIRSTISRIRQDRRPPCPSLMGISALALPVALTLLAASALESSAHRARQERFDRVAFEVVQAVRERLDTNKQVAIGGQALFAASSRVEPWEWRNYVYSLQLGTRFPGIRGLGYAVSVPGAGGLADRFPVLYVEPRAANEAAIGFDLHSEAYRRSAAERARDTGEASLSGVITLVQDPKGGPGFLLFLPVYRHGAATQTVLERRAALEGWVFAVFRAQDLMRGLPARSLGVDFEIADVTAAAAFTPFYGEDGPRTAEPSAFASNQLLEIGGRTWQLRMASLPAFHVGGHEPAIVLGLGLLASLLIAGIVCALSTTRTRALALAAQRMSTLRDTEARTRSILENMLGGLITVDAGGLIESLNPAAERMFGYAREELVGRHLAVLVPETTPAAPAEFLRASFPRAIGRVSEWQGRRKSGEVFPFELSMFEFRGNDGARCFAGSVRDISEELEVDRLKKEFLATVSHELRTPLTSIRGSLSLLAGDALGELPDEAAEIVRIAERNTVRLIALVNDILDLERLENGRMQMRPAPTELSGIVERSFDSIRAFAEGRRVRLESEPMPESVVVDADRIVQVLVNLLSNAVKFSPQESTVTVSADRGPGWVEVRVSDRGRGVPIAQQAAIFQRFRQVEASDARHEGGTGLGLAICKAIVEQHGGSIGVASREGEGSIFWVRLPAGDRLLESVGSDDGQHQGDVLLADDDEAVLGVLARQLLVQRIPVRMARTGREAVREAKRHPPGIIVLDVGLPEGDGFDVVEALSADPATSALPLLVYTVHELTEDQRRRLRLGPTRYLTKAVAGDDELIVDVKELLEHKEAAA